LIDSILSFEYFILAFGAGIIGAILGIGGGIIIVPALTIMFNIPIHYAIGASITAVVATSTTSASSYIKSGLVNIRLGLFLEAGTAFGALLGALIATLLQSEILFIIFSIILIYTSYSMYTSSKTAEYLQFAKKNDYLANKLHLQGDYIRTINNKIESNQYYVDKTSIMFGVSIGAGIASGLLGVGGGFIKVPALVKISKLPMKSAAATSNFMIGVTAGTSALVYLNNGFIDPILAIPIAMGTLFGALIGVRLIKYIKGNRIRVLFAILLLFISVQLFLKGINFNLTL
jgi:hypothetical protein